MGSVRGRALSEADVRAMLGLVADLSSLEELEDFRSGVLPGIRGLVPCEVATYNEVDFPSASMIAMEDPVGFLAEDDVEAFVRLGRQNPLIARYERTRDGRPYKWSELITRRELHRTELYREVFAGMGVEYQMAFALPSPPGLIIGFA